MATKQRVNSGPQKKKKQFPVMKVTEGSSFYCVTGMARRAEVVVVVQIKSTQ